MCGAGEPAAGSTAGRVGRTDGKMARTSRARLSPAKKEVAKLAKIARFGSILQILGELVLG